MMLTMFYNKGCKGVLELSSRFDMNVLSVFVLAASSRQFCWHCGRMFFLAITFLPLIESYYLAHTGCLEHTKSHSSWGTALSLIGPSLGGAQWQLPQMMWFSLHSLVLYVAAYVLIVWQHVLLVLIILHPLLINRYQLSTMDEARTYDEGPPIKLKWKKYILYTLLLHQVSSNAVWAW